MNKPDRKTRWQRWRRWIVRLLVVLLLLGGISVYWLTRPQQLQRLIVSVLHEATGAQVTLDGAKLNWTEGLYLTGLTISLPDYPDGELFTAQSIQINPSVLSLLFGSIEADSIVLDHPTFYLTEDITTDQYLFQKLHQPTEPSPPEDSEGLFPVIARVPEVLVRSGQIVFREINAGTLDELDTLLLEGTLTALPDTSGGYGFELRRMIPSSHVPGERLHGQFNLHESSFQAALEGFQFEQPQRYFLRHNLRGWWDQLDPQGAFSTLEVGYHPDQGWQAQLTLDHASLNVPLEEDLSPRMTDVSGRLHVTGHRMILDNLDGIVEGLRYRVTGEVPDLRDRENAAFSVRGVTDWFEVQPGPDVVKNLPHVVLKHYGRFKPAGRFRVEVECLRPQANGPIRVAGQIFFQEASLAYYKFPYPAHDVEGMIHFDREAIIIDHLTAKGPTGGTFSIESGKISPPGEGAQVDIRILGDNVPIDDALRQAMKPKHRKVLDLFFDQTHYQRLLDADLLQTPGGSQDDALHAFALGGIAKHIVVDIHRPQGHGVKTKVTSAINVEGIHAIYHHWPYPLTGTGGTVVVSPNDVAVDVQLRGPTGAVGQLKGTLTKHEGQPLSPDLYLKEVELPIDGLLIASLPPPQDQWVSDLSLQGKLRGGGRVWQPAKENVLFKLNANLVDGRATPYDASFTLEPLTGQLVIERGRLAIDKLIGQRNGSTLSITGKLDWSRPTLDLTMDFEANDLTLHKDVFDLLPPDHPARKQGLDLFAHYRPTGTVDATLTYRRGEKVDQDEYRLTVTPKELAFDLRGQRVAFTDMTGQADVQPNQLILNKLHGQFNDNDQLTATGNVQFDDATSLNLTLEGEVSQLGPTTRALLPTGVLTTLDALQINGVFRLKRGELRNDDQGYSFEATLRLMDATMQIGVPVTKLDGRLTLHVSQTAEQLRPRISIDLHAERLRASDRAIRLLNVHLESDDEGEQLIVNEFLGSIYGGALIGHGAIKLGQPGRYFFDLTLADVELGPFLAPLDYPDAQRFEPHPVDEPSYVDSPQRKTDTGLLSTNLLIESIFNQPQSRQGRGTLEVHSAKIYNQPIPLALLQTLNLTLPTDHSFNRASARYLVDGDRVLFDTLRFDAPSLAISGTGWMDYPTQKLSLEMVTRNPAMPDFGAVGQMFNVIKDELVAIRVTGTLTEPKSRAVSFQGIRRSWDELFTGKAARGRRGKSEPAAAP